MGHGKIFQHQRQDARSHGGGKPVGREMADDFTGIVVGHIGKQVHENIHPD